MYLHKMGKTNPDCLPDFRKPEHLMGRTQNGTADDVPQYILRAMVYRAICECLKPDRVSLCKLSIYEHADN